MALESNSNPTTALRGHLREASRLAANGAHAVGGRYQRVRSSFGYRFGPFLSGAADVLRDTWLMRFISRSLLRRIVASNLLGLAILLAGLTYLIQFNSWLIDAKIEHLRAQSHIMATAIASKAQLVEQSQADASGFRDNPFAALEFSIPQEVVVPLLPQLLQKTTNRGRVYDVNGVLIGDSSRILRPGSIIPIGPQGRLIERKPKTENIFTRMTQWLMMNSDLRVYKEIGRANGRFYPEVQAALKGESTALMMLAQRRKIVSVATPIIRGNEVRGVLLLSTQPGAIDDVQANEFFAVLVLISVAAAAAILASVLLSRTVAEPVRQLSQYANDVTHDIQAARELPRFDERTDEVGQLARSFSLMTRALYRRIEASEKFAADVAHELKNPLTAARSTAESLVYVKSDAQREEFIEQIQLELKRLNKLISDVSDASRLDAELALHRFEPVDLSVVARNLVDTFNDLADGGRRIELVVVTSAIAEPFLVLGQEGRVGQVLTNLLANALSFTPPGGTVKVHLERHSKMIDLMVEDQGPGIEPNQMDKIFARFYTFRPDQASSRTDNSGLGLSISREIVDAHGGKIWVENVDAAPTADSAGAPRPSGARFFVRLPAGDGKGRAKQDRLSGGR